MPSREAWQRRVDEIARIYNGTWMGMDAPSRWHPIKRHRMRRAGWTINFPVAWKPTPEQR